MPPRLATYGVLGVVLAVMATACEQELVLPEGPAGNGAGLGSLMPRRSTAGIMVSEARMYELILQLTREVAVAIDDPSVRKAVFDGLHGSPYREHKLHFRTFLAQEGRALRNAMAVARAGAGAVEATLDSLVDLEFYMPVKEHWRRWDGGPDVIVASAMRHEREIPRAYDLHGRPVTLTSAETPPPTPTLVLIPVETNFSQPPMSPGNSAPQLAISNHQSGLYMTAATINDKFEGFSAGEPEFEVHIYLGRDPPGQAMDVNCTGELRGHPTWNYDNPPATWTGNVQIWVLQGQPVDTMIVPVVFEDDFEKCFVNAQGQIEGMPPHGGPSLGTIIKGILYNAALVAIGIVYSPEATAATFLVTGGWDQELNFFGSFNDDDFVGVADGPNRGCFDPGTAMDYRLRGEGSINGSVRLQWIAVGGDPIPAQPTCPPAPFWVDATGPGTAPEYSTVTVAVTNAANYTPPLTYYWSVNDSPVCGTSNSCDATVGAGGSSVTFRVTSRDANGLLTTDVHSVTAEYPGCPTCTRSGSASVRR